MFRVSTWQLRATALRLMAANGPGYALYQWFQRRIGDCGKPSFWLGKLKDQVAMAAKLRALGRTLEGTQVLEVGTGWVPCFPIGFWLCGATNVHTYDLNAHLLPDVLREMLRWMAVNERLLQELYSEVDRQLLSQRLALVRSLTHDPFRFLQEAGVVRHAPGDASATGLQSGSVDIHYSTNVIEHIPEPVIGAILAEADRVLRPGGIAIHFIDPRDHFAYTDPTLSGVNFLRYSAQEWNRIAGNRLAYHNRLRQPVLLHLFRASGLAILHEESRIDSRSLEFLRSGISIAPGFRQHSLQDLAREDVLIVAQKPADSSNPLAQS